MGDSGVYNIIIYVKCKKIVVIDQKKTLLHPLPQFIATYRDPQPHPAYESPSDLKAVFNSSNFYKFCAAPAPAVRGRCGD